MKTKPDYGDPLDYPDIPPNAGLSDAYHQATTPDHVAAAIKKRQAALAARRIAAGRRV